MKTGRFTEMPTLDCNFEHLTSVVIELRRLKLPCPWKCIDDMESNSCQDLESDFVQMQMPFKTLSAVLHKA